MMGRVRDLKNEEMHIIIEKAFNKEISPVTLKGIDKKLKEDCVDSCGDLPSGIDADID